MSEKAKAKAKAKDTDTRTTVYLDEEKYKLAKSIMALKGDSLKDLVNEKIDTYIKENKQLLSG